MKLLTIFIKDTGKNNRKLIKTITDNYQYYPELDESLEIIYLSKTDYELPDYIKLISEVKEVELNTKYVMFINDADNFSCTLPDLCIELNEKAGDVIISSLGENDHRLNQVISQKKYDEYLKVATNRMIWGTIFKREFIENNKINIDLKLRGDGISLIIESLMYAPVVDYLKIKFYQIETDKWWTNTESANELFETYDEVFKIISLDVENPIGPYALRAMIKRIRRQKLSRVRGWRKVKHKHRNTYNVLKAKLSLNERLELVKPRRIEREFNLIKRAETLVYYFASKYEFKQKKIVIIDPDNEYEHEIKYLVKKIHRAKSTTNYQIFCVGSGKNEKITYLTTTKEIKFQLLTANQIIGFDFKNLIDNRRTNQDYTQVITQLNEECQLLNETENRLLNYESEQRDVISTIWIDSSENDKLLKSLIEGVNVENQELASTRWLKKNKYNTPLFSAILQKYHLSEQQNYVLYIPEFENHKIFIDIKTLIEQLEDEEKLVIYLMPEIDYELVNFDKMPYHLFSNGENLTELMLVMQSIKTNYGNYRQDFERLNRTIK